MYPRCDGILVIIQLAKKEHLFPAPDDDSTLAMQVELLGRDNFDRFVQDQKLDLPKELLAKLTPPGRRKPWSSVLPMSSLSNPEHLVDLLEKLLEFNYVNIETDPD